MLMNDILSRAYLRLVNIREVGIRDTYYDRDLRKWVIYFSVTSSHPKGNLLNPSFWYCLIDLDYPYGSINIYPCKDRGIKETYYHQNRNRILSDRKWKSGKLCLDYSYDASGPRFNKMDEYGNESMLEWHIRRVVQWIDSADSGKLISTGEPCELPDFGTVEDDITIGFISDEKVQKVFSEHHGKYGFFDYLYLSTFKFPLVINYYDKKWKEIVSFEGLQLKRSRKSHGIWIYLEKPPTFNFWQTPYSFSELVDTLKSHGVNFSEVLRIIIERLKNNEVLTFVGIGFPFSKNMGDEPSFIHWQFLKIPNIDLKPHGFREITSSILDYHIYKWKEADIPLKWVRSKNINPENLYSRVPETKFLKDFRFIVIGLGSLGSTVCESLVRSGVKRMTLIDYDVFLEGNLCRHSLAMNAIGENKSKAMFEKLSNINPFVEVDFIERKFTHELDIKLDDKTILLDFSSEDAAIHSVERYKYIKAGIFFSFSFGLNADPLYCYRENLESVSLQKFRSQITPYLKPSREIEELPNEGIGCWNPVFPASFFSIQSIAHSCYQFIKYNIERNTGASDFAIYQNTFDDEGVFLGVSKIV